MKKTTHIFPIIALSTLLAACSNNSGKDNNDLPAVNKTKPATTNIAKPATQKQPNVEQPKTEQPSVEQPQAEQPKAEQPKAEQSKVEQPKAEQPKVEQPKVEQPKVEQPKAEQPKVEQPKVEQPKTEQPKVEQPKVEQPKVEQPQAEQPQAEQPQAEQPQAEQPKTEQPNVEQPKVEPPKAEQEIWSNAGDFPHNKDAVPVVYLIENDNAKYDIDPNIKEKQNAIITLKVGTNRDAKNHYDFRSFDENMYYGFFRDSNDMNHIDNHYVYSFNEKAENKADLDGLTATYQGKFIYSTKSIPELAVPSNVELRYKNGKAEGEITSHFYGDTLFDVKSLDNSRTLELQPKREMLDNSFDELNTNPNSPDRAIIELHFIHGKDGTENKSLVGKGGNDKYWGVLGAEKQ